MSSEEQHTLRSTNMDFYTLEEATRPTSQQDIALTTFPRGNIAVDIISKRYPVLDSRELSSEDVANRLILILSQGIDALDLELAHHERRDRSIKASGDIDKALNIVLGAFPELGAKSKGSTYRLMCTLATGVEYMERGWKQALKDCATRGEQCIALLNRIKANDEEIEAVQRELSLAKEEVVAQRKQISLTEKDLVDKAQALEQARSMERADLAREGRLAKDLTLANEEIAAQRRRIADELIDKDQAILQAQNVGSAGVVREEKLGKQVAKLEKEVAAQKVQTGSAQKELNKVDKQRAKEVQGLKIRIRDLEASSVAQDSELAIEKLDHQASTDKLDAVEKKLKDFKDKQKIFLEQAKELKDERDRLKNFQVPPDFEAQVRSDRAKLRDEEARNKQLESEFERLEQGRIADASTIQELSGEKFRLKEKLAEKEAALKKERNKKAPTEGDMAKELEKERARSKELEERLAALQSAR